MPSLREMLDRQKQEKANGVAKPVLQSQTVKTETPPEETNGEKRTISTGQTNGNEEISGTKPEGNSVVEQGPPEGLSPFQLLKWKKEHATSPAQTSTISTVHVEQTEQGTTGVSDTGNGDIKNINGAGTVNSNSASQAADAQKTNDGQIDVESLRNDLTYLANNIEQREIVGQVVRKIAQQLRQTPELTPYMTDADMDLMVRGLRSAYSIAARKKTEKADTKKKGSALDNELAGALAGLGLTLS